MSEVINPEKISYCPYCQKNCYTPKQLEMHIRAKNRWCERKGVPPDHVKSELENGKI